MPSIDWQAHQVRKEFLRTRRDGEIDAIAGHHLRDLFRCALMKMQPDFGILGPERADDLRQHVARLRMGGRDRQGSAVGLAQLGRGPAYVLHFAQDAGGA
jgi:hypothetical protein